MHEICIALESLKVAEATLAGKLQKSQFLHEPCMKAFFQILHNLLLSCYMQVELLNPLVCFAQIHLGLKCFVQMKDCWRNGCWKIAEYKLRNFAWILHGKLSKLAFAPPQVPFCSTKAQVIGTFNQFDPSKFLFVPQKPKHVLVSCN